ncbi:MAG: PfkB family carbohydrate kinase [Candidatus Binatia bacterium]
MNNGTQNNNIDGKIKSLADLAEITSRLKEQGKRIVHCHGIFDLVHPGHIRHLGAAKQKGEVLIVTVTPDAYVNKGPGRPVFNQRLRVETLAALEYVDFAAVNEWPTAVEAIQLLRPDVYVKGSDYVQREDDITGKIYEEEKAILAVGGQIHFTQDITFSSTHLLNSYFDVLPPEADVYLRRFRQQYNADEVIQHLTSLNTLKVLVVGDAIVDEYHLCRPYGMASKSSAVAAQFLSTEAYAGGSLAVANHLAGFCKHVHLVTCLGEQDSRQEFISQHLKPNVSSKFFFRPDAPTVIKRRYVQSFLVTKLFEVSFFNDQLLPPAVEQLFCQYLSSVMGDYDVVVVADFGHGLIGPAAIETICQKAPFIAINTQLNSINLGYNTITKYPRADYVCIDEEETRMASRERYGSLEQSMQGLAHKLHCRMMTVTRGYRGSVTYQADNGYVTVPVLSREVVDTIGAGDAYLAITAPCVYKGFPPELVGFIGNTVGALAVRTVGNKEAVEPIPLFRFIGTLLK